VFPLRWFGTEISGREYAYVVLTVAVLFSCGWTIALSWRNLRLKTGGVNSTHSVLSIAWWLSAPIVVATRAIVALFVIGPLALLVACAAAGRPVFALGSLILLLSGAGTAYVLGQAADYLRHDSRLWTCPHCREPAHLLRTCTICGCELPGLRRGAFAVCLLVGVVVLAVMCIAFMSEAARHWSVDEQHLQDGRADVSTSSEANTGRTAVADAPDGPRRRD